MTRTEPIVAWRVWRLRTDGERGLVEPVLESCIYGDEWPERTPLQADCPEHRRPSPDCACGIYAVTARAAAFELARWAQSALPHPIVLGRVQLWGRVLPYSAGYRAELAYPYELDVLAGNGLDEAERGRLRRALRARYVVDVLPLAA